MASTQAAATLDGAIVELRLAASADVAALARIRAHPDVYERWGGGADLASAVADELGDAESTGYVILFEGEVVGWIQYRTEDDPDYRHASLDVYVDATVHGRGIGTDAVRSLVRHLVAEQGHHRITIDPAADNAAAIRCYDKVGFRPVGVMRHYERGPDGTWHDNLLMDLLADDLAD